MRTWLEIHVVTGLTVILTDILQNEKNKPELYQTVNKILKAKNVDRFIGIGPEIVKNADRIDISNKEVYPDKSAFIKQFRLNTFRNENILVKGARKFGLEEIVQLLEKQTHQTIFEINLTAIRDNFITIKNQLPAKTKIMGMVKAFSYGSGSYEIANHLQFLGIDYLRSRLKVDESINAQLFKNALVESSLLHIRILTDIFLSRGKRTDDINLKQLGFGTNSTKPVFAEKINALTRAYGEASDQTSNCWILNKMLAHPTTHRTERHDYSALFASLNKPLKEIIEYIYEYAKRPLPFLFEP